MKKLFLYAACAAALLCGARDTNRYDRVEVRQGFEYSQRGGLGPSNEVVTAVVYPDVASNLAEGASFVPFSNAVARVTPPIELQAESDPHVSSWARKVGGADAPAPVSDARDLTHKDDFFVDLRTNRDDGVSLAFSRAVNDKVVHPAATKVYGNASSKAEYVDGYGRFVSRYPSEDAVLSAATSSAGGAYSTLTYRPNFISQLSTYHRYYADAPSMSPSSNMRFLDAWFSADGGTTGCYPETSGAVPYVQLTACGPGSGGAAYSWMNTERKQLSDLDFYYRLPLLLKVTSSSGSFASLYPVGSYVTVSNASGTSSTKRLYREGDSFPAAKLSGRDAVFSAIADRTAPAAEVNAASNMVVTFSPPVSSIDASKVDGLAAKVASDFSNPSTPALSNRVVSVVKSTEAPWITDGRWSVYPSGRVTRTDVTRTWSPSVVSHVKAYDGDGVGGYEWIRDDAGLRPLLAGYVKSNLVDPDGDFDLVTDASLQFPGCESTYRKQMGSTGKYVYFGFSSRPSGSGSFWDIGGVIGYGTASSLPEGGTFDGLSPSTLSKVNMYSYAASNEDGVPYGGYPVAFYNYVESSSEQQYEDTGNWSELGLGVTVEVSTQGGWVYHTNVVDVGTVLFDAKTDRSKMGGSHFFDNLRTNAVTEASESFSNAVNSVRDNSAYYDRIADYSHAVGADGAAYDVVHYEVTNRTYRFDSWSCTATNKLTAAQKDALDGAVGAMLYRDEGLLYPQYAKKAGSSSTLDWIRKSTASATWRLSFAGQSALNSTTGSASQYEGSDLVLVNHTTQRDVTYRISYHEEIVPKIRYEKVGDYALKSYVDAKPVEIAEEGSSAKWTPVMTSGGTRMLLLKEE